MELDDDPNMISSNLPLLFMDGHPTTFEEMHTEKLEDFITFMVKCSLGHDTAKEINVPKWWPKNIPFTNPFRRVDGYRYTNWRESLISLIIKCYKYHRMEEMLDFSVKLASLPRKQLRPLDNWNGTTSFYDKRTRKLLVTIRNELLTYDHRKYPLRNKHKLVETVILESEMETYSCQNCYEDFNSLEEVKVHESKCVTLDPLNDDNNSDVEIIEIDSYEMIKVSCDNISKDNFLKVFNLCSVKDGGVFAQNNEKQNSSSTSTTTTCTKDMNKRTLVSLMKCPNIPFSSTIGQLLLKKSNKKLTHDNIQERINRIERFTKSSPVKSKGATLPKHIVTVNTLAFKKRDHYSTRKYNFRMYRRRRHPYLNSKSQLLYNIYNRELQIHLRSLTDIDVLLINEKLKIGVSIGEIINSLKVTTQTTSNINGTFEYDQSSITIDDEPEIIVISDTEDDNSIDVEMMNVVCDSRSDDDIEIIDVQPPLTINSFQLSHNHDPLEDVHKNI